MGHIASTTVDGRLHQRLRGWAARHVVPYSRLIRRLLLLVPWWRDDVSLVVLPIPKTVTRDGEKLRAWLAEATEEIVEHYGGVSAHGGGTSTEAKIAKDGGIEK